MRYINLKDRGFLQNLASNFLSVYFLFFFSYEEVRGENTFFETSEKKLGLICSVSKTPNKRVLKNGGGIR